jgi:membrane-bound serine protease (ClpP class)
VKTSRLGIFVALLVGIGLLSGALFAQTRNDQIAAVQATPATQPATPAVVIKLSGVVNDYNRDALKKRFKAARALGAKTIILEVDTYGGTVVAGLDISRFLKQQTDLHIIAYVPDKAISAGVMIALAADELVMAPGAMIGDSAPIAISTQGQMQTVGAAERAKMESPVLADFYDSAIRNGYDPLLAEAMVSVGRSVYYIEKPDSGRKFVEADDYARLKKEGWEDVPNIRIPIDSADTLLTVGTIQAEQIGLAKAVYNSTKDLAQARNLNVLATLEPTWGEGLVGWLGSDGVRLVLLIAFFVSLYIAIHIPGSGLPEAVALFSLSVFLGVPLLTGFAQWWEILVIVIGLGLIALEAFVIPGFGVPGIAGLILLFGGLLMTFVPDEPGRSPFSIPQSPATWDGFQSGLLVMLGGLVGAMILSWWVRRYLPKLPYFNRLILTNVAGGGGVMATNPTLGDDTPLWPAISSVGTAMTDLLPGGTAKFQDDVVGAERVVHVVSDSGFIAQGTKVFVREVGGNRVVVRSMESAADIKAPNPAPEGAQ